MANEAKAAKRHLVQQITNRRGEVLLSIFGTIGIDEYLAYLFSDLEKKFILKHSIGDAPLNSVLNIRGREWAFGIKPPHFLRYALYTPVAFTALLAGDAIAKPLYKMLSPSTDNTIQQLEQINHRESYLHSLPLRIMLLILCMALEVTTDLKIPKMLFLILLSGAVFSAKEEYNSALSTNHDRFIENTNFDRMNHPAVFFKVPREFTEKPENQTVVDLMLNGTLNKNLKGLGFFERDKTAKGYDLKARGENGERGYFKKEADGEYSLLESKPEKPRKTL